MNLLTQIEARITAYGGIESTLAIIEAERATPVYYEPPVKYVDTPFRADHLLHPETKQVKVYIRPKRPSNANPPKSSYVKVEKWTDDKIKYLAKNYYHMSDLDLSIKLGLGKRSIGNKIVELGLSLKNGRVRSKLKRSLADNEFGGWF